MKTYSRKGLSLFLLRRNGFCTTIGSTHSQDLYSNSLLQTLIFAEIYKQKACRPVLEIESTKTFLHIFQVAE